MWKWIHTLTCPDIEEYGGFNNLRNYCLKCLSFVLDDSSSDWCKAAYVRRIIKSENCKIRSLQQHCIKQIIEGNLQITRLPDNLKKQIQEEKQRKEDGNFRLFD